MSARALLPRMLVIAALLVGWIGMHHLAVAACHHGTSVSQAGDHAHDAPGPQQAPFPAEDEPMVEIALTCLAVLALLMLSAPGLARAVRRARRAPPLMSRLAALGRWLDPPDLALLSISRT